MILILDYRLNHTEHINMHSNTLITVSQFVPGNIMMFPPEFCYCSGGKASETAFSVSDLKDDVEQFDVTKTS